MEYLKYLELDLILPATHFPSQSPAECQWNSCFQGVIGTVINAELLTLMYNPLYLEKVTEPFCDFSDSVEWSGHHSVSQNYDPPVTSGQEVKTITKKQSQIARFNAAGSLKCRRVKLYLSHLIENNSGVGGPLL